MNSGIFSYVMMFFLFYMIFSIFTMQKKNAKNKRMLGILSKFDEKDEFFAEADEYISTEKDPEYNTKLQILRLWGYAYYEEDEKFREQVAALDLNPILYKGNKSNISVNEDSFFYLFLAIPNRLYYRDRADLRQVLADKMAEYDSAVGNMMLKSINEAAEKFYTKTDDLGKEFFLILVNGEYSGLTYSKQLIGLYKQSAEVFLSKLAQDENDEDTFRGYLDDLKNFEQSRLGKRLIKELGVVMPAAPAEAETEEAEACEEPAEAETKEDGVTAETADEALPEDEMTAETAEEALPEDEASGEQDSAGEDK